MGELDKEMNGSHKQILRSSLVIGSASLINIIIGLLRMKLVAVMLGPSGVGLVGVLNNWMAVGTTVSSVGIGTAATRAIAEAKEASDQKRVDSVRASLFWLTIVLSSSGMIAFVIVGEIFSHLIIEESGKSYFLSYVAIGVALSVAAGSQRALLTGMRRVRDIAIVTILSSLFSAVIGCLAIYAIGEAGVIVLVLAGPLGGFLVGSIFVSKVPKGRVKLNFSHMCVMWREFFGLGGSVMLAGVSIMLGELVVRVIVQRYEGGDGLGYFQASWSISMTYIGFILGAMGADYYPRLAGSIHNKVLARRLVNEQAEVAVLLSGPVLVGMMAFSPVILSLLYTDEFVSAASVLRWQILGDVFKVVSWPMGFVILASNKGRIFVLTEFFAIFVFCVLSWLFVPVYGVEAVGFSFFVMYFSYLPLLAYVSWRLIGYKVSYFLIRESLVLFFAVIFVAVLGSYGDSVSGIFGGFASFLMILRNFKILSRRMGGGGRLAKLVALVGRRLGGKSSE